MTALELAAQIKTIADWMGERLADADYDRRAVAESGVTQLRELAAQIIRDSAP